MRGTEVRPRLERGVEIGLECQEIIINSQNDLNFTLIICQAQQLASRGGGGREDVGVSILDSSSNKEGVRQCIVDNRQVLVIP